MTYCSTTLISAAVLLLTAPGAALADSVLFTNFGAGFSYITSFGDLVGNGLDGNTYAQGATFVPGVTTKLSSIDIALSCAIGCSGSVIVQLDQNSGGAPGAALETFTIPGSSLGAFGANNPPLALTSALQPLLTAGVSYWVTARIGSNPNDSAVWNANSTGDTSAEALSFDNGGTWFSPSGLTPGAYEVNGVSTVPEPSGAILLGSGILLAGIGRRRLRGRRRKAGLENEAAASGWK